MKLIDSILYLEFNDVLECNFFQTVDNVRHLKKELSRGAKWLRSIKDPTDNRKVLIEYESLSDDRKQKVIQRFNNPYENVIRQPIKDLVIKDLKAEEYFLQYRYNEDKKLPIEVVNEYTKAASWLNMLVIIRSDRKQVKKQLGISIGDFWKNIIELIATEKVSLPTNPIRLFEKIDTYEKESYSCIIHKGYGHTNSRKVNSELSEALLLQLIAQPNKHDDVIICQAYNKWAAANAHKEISPQTVGNWRRKNEYQLMLYRDGNKDWYNKFGKQIQRNRPTAPMLLLGSDDNDLDFYFQEQVVNKKGHSVTNYYHRVKAIVIMDAYNDYILGYAFAETITADLVRLAWLDAVYHIHDITGSFYLPLQLQTDRWGNGTLSDFYKSLGIYTPATAKVARGKYIERAFGVQWQQQQKFYPNYSGPNITAKGKANDEHIDRVKKDFPHKDQAHQQIEHFINTMRNLTDEKTGKTKQQQWLDAFNVSALSKKKEISDMQLLLTFGRVHDYKNTITNKGITPAINCTEHNYEIPDEYYLQTVGKRVQVIYEPFDYSRILVTDGGSLRFIAREYQKLPSALADYKPGDRQRLNDRLEQKKMHVQMIAADSNNRQQTLQRNRINAESLLQAGVMRKEIKQSAELVYRSGGGTSENVDPLDLM